MQETDRELAKRVCDVVAVATDDIDTITVAVEDGVAYIEGVVVGFKTHFDLGFTDLPKRVMALYTGPMFDAVRDVMEATATQPPNLQYKWTLPAWPLRYLLHSQTVPEDTRMAARELVEDGRLLWHV